MLKTIQMTAATTIKAIWTLAFTSCSLIESLSSSVNCINSSTQVLMSAQVCKASYWLASLAQFQAPTISRTTASTAKSDWLTTQFVLTSLRLQCYPEQLQQLVIIVNKPQIAIMAAKMAPRRPTVIGQPSSISSSFQRASMASCTLDSQSTEKQIVGRAHSQLARVIRYSPLFSK